MFGTVVNTLAIVVGSLLGLLLRGGIPEKYSTTVIHAIGLAVVLIGLKGALQSDAILLIIFCMAIGAWMGEFLAIERRLDRLAKRVEARFSRSSGDFAKGLVTTTLLFCVGSMAIVGALESGLTGNHQTLFAKSVLDGISSIIFASTFGIGVIFSALTVLVYQGAITLSAALVKPLLTPEVVGQMSAIGGLLIMAIGLSLLDIKRIKVANMLPAVFLPLVYYGLQRLIGWI